MATWLAHSVPIRDTCVCSSKHCPNIFHNSRQPSNNSFSHRLAGELTKTSFPSQVVLLLWVRPFQQSYLCPMRAFLRAWPCSVGHTQAGRCHTCQECAFSKVLVYLESSCGAGPGQPAFTRKQHEVHIGHLSVWFPLKCQFCVLHFVFESCP